MSYAEWPLAVPYRPERDMWGVKPVRDAAETQMEGGNVRLRRRPGDRLATMRWGRQMKPDEAAAFLAFIASIGDGTHRFWMPVCLDGSTYTIRLVQITGGLPEEATPGGGWLTANLSLLVFPPELGPPPPAFDAFASQLYAIYGLTRLRSSYAGPGVRVRRSSDGAETDIGFTFLGALDVAGLLAFAGTASAFVVAWYDQSGNGRHATQSVTASQPRLVNAGLLYTGPNGGPALAFSGAQSFSIGAAAGIARNAANLTMAVAGMSSTTAQSAAFFSCARGTNLSWYRAALLHTPTLGSARFAASANDMDNPPLASRAYVTGAWARFIGRGRFAEGSIDFAINGATITQATGTTTPSVDSDSSVVAVGRSPNGGTPLSGQLSTLVLSRAALDVAALDAALQGTLP